MARIRYSQEERAQILAAAARPEVHEEYACQSMTVYFRAAMELAIPADRWRNMTNLSVAGMPSYQWFRDGLEAIRLGQVFSPPAPSVPSPRIYNDEPVTIPPLTASSLTTAELITELLIRFNTTASQLVNSISSLEATIANLTRTTSPIDKIAVVAQPVPAVASVIAPPPATATSKPSVPATPSPAALATPKPNSRPKLKIKIIGPLKDQQRIIINRAGELADLSFLDSSRSVSLSDFQNCDRAIITRHGKHQATYQAVNVLGRENVIRLSSSGIGTIVDVIAKLARGGVKSTYGTIQ